MPNDNLIVFAKCQKTRKVSYFGVEIKSFHTIPFPFFQPSLLNKLFYLLLPVILVLCTKLKGCLGFTPQTSWFHAPLTLKSKVMHTKKKAPHYLSLVCVSHYHVWLFPIRKMLRTTIYEIHLWSHAMGLSINNQSPDQAAASPGLTKCGNFVAASNSCCCLIAQAFSFLWLYGKLNWNWKLRVVHWFFFSKGRLLIVHFRFKETLAPLWYTSCGTLELCDIILMIIQVKF